MSSHPNKTRIGELYYIHNYSMTEIASMEGLARAVLYKWRDRYDWEGKRLRNMREVLDSKGKLARESDTEFKSMVSKDTREIIANGLEVLKGRIGYEKKPSLLIKTIEGVVKVRLMIEENATEVIKELDIAVKRTGEEKEGKVIKYQLTK